MEHALAYWAAGGAGGPGGATSFSDTHGRSAESAALFRSVGAAPQAPTGGAVPRRARVVRVQFSLLSPEEKQRMSAAEITKPVVFDKNLPQADGVNDTRLGTIDRRIICSTCQNAMGVCPGHFGHVRFSVPLWHVGHLDRCLKLLEVLCPWCSSLMAREDDVRFRGVFAKDGRRDKERFLALMSVKAAGANCPSCARPKPRYRKVGVSIAWSFSEAQLAALSEEDRAWASLPLNAAMARDIFTNIREEDLPLLNVDPRLNHPAWMIIDNFSVLPPICRPSVMVVEGSKRRGHDDLTPQTQNIIKAEMELRRELRREAGEGAAGAGGAGAGGGGGGGGGADEEEEAEAEGEEEAEGEAEGLLAPADPVLAGGAGAAAAVLRREGVRRLVSRCDLTEAEVALLEPEREDPFLYVTGRTAAAIWAQCPDKCERLQNEVAVYFKNDGKAVPQARQRSGGAMRLLFDRWKGKAGRFRNSMMGKRADFTSRSVITPRPDADLDELYVPQRVARVLTIPERVTPLNHARLTECVLRGPHVLGGATRVLFPDHTIITLDLDPNPESTTRRHVRLVPGCVVERHLQDGDPLLFNRHPSLHRMSIMAFRAVVKRDASNTFSFNLSCTTPFNADFDGDEMNIHVPQTEEAQIEARALLWVSSQIISPGSNRPIMALVQDALLGASVLTHRDTRVSRAALMQMVMQLRYPCRDLDALFEGYARPWYSGKEAFSMLLPEEMALTLHTNGARAGETDPAADPDERVIVVRGGRLLHGRMHKGALGTVGGGVVQRLMQDHGPSRTMQFLSDAQRVINHWFVSEGFTVGIGDCVTDEVAERGIDSISVALETDVRTVMRRKEELRRYLTHEQLERVEQRVMVMLATALDRANRVVIDGLRRARPGNNVVRCVNAGSKGKPMNVSQIMGCVGQTSLEGRRLQPGVDGRTLPYFAFGTATAAAQGYIARSYKRGLLPSEFFFHMMGGREGLVDTAVKTSDTGYKQRCIGKALEELSGFFDGTVRDGSGRVVSFAYGGDGFTPELLELVDLRAHRVLDWDLEREGAEIGLPAEALRWLRWERAHLIAPPGPLARALLPFNPVAFLERLAPDAAAAAELEPATAVAQLQHAARFLELAMGARTASLLKHVLVYFGLRAARAGGHPALGAFLESVAERVVRARLARGEMVGIIAAQSIGEPSTQMTLNSFHSAGVTTLQVTQGVPRLNELLRVSTRIRTPITGLPILAGTRHSARALARSLVHVPLHALLRSSYVAVDRVESTLSELPDDIPALHAVRVGFGEELPGSLRDFCAPHVVRLVLDDGMARERGVSPQDVARAIARAARLPLRSPAALFHKCNTAVWAGCAPGLSVTYAPLTARHWAVRVRVLRPPALAAKDHAMARDLHALLLARVTVRGWRQAQEADVAPDERAINVLGSCLLKASTLNWCDWYRTTSNHVAEVYDVLGVCAARRALREELLRVMTADGGYIDTRHVALLAEAMTCRGFVMPISRFGINRIETGPLLRASFEETVEVVLEAGRAREADLLSDAAAAAMLGALAPIGTGAVAVQQAPRSRHAIAADTSVLPLRRDGDRKGDAEREMRYRARRDRDAALAAERAAALAPPPGPGPGPRPGPGPGPGPGPALDAEGFDPARAAPPNELRVRSAPAPQAPAPPAPPAPRAADDDERPDAQYTEWVMEELRAPAPARPQHALRDLGSFDARRRFNAAPADVRRPFMGAAFDEAPLSIPRVLLCAPALFDPASGLWTGGPARAM